MASRSPQPPTPANLPSHQPEPPSRDANPVDRGSRLPLIAHPMDELRELIRAAVLNEDGTFPELRDLLPHSWDRIPADAMDADLPRYTQRTTLLASYSNWAFTKPWAWEGLRRLLEMLRDRNEPIPEILQWWAYDVAIGRRKPPGSGRGRPAKSERNARIVGAMRMLRAHGFSREAAIEEIAAAAPGMPFETVRSAVRKYEEELKAGPFPPSR